MTHPTVTVIVPTHLPEPDAMGKVSLAQTLSVLHRHVITFVVPVGLDVRWYEDFCRGKAEVRFERFEWHGFFEYSRLMLNPAFYRRFLDYDYVLICHLDAFVFKDELLEWCERGYDYIGSVIYRLGWKDGVPLSRRKAMVNAGLRKLLRTRRTEYLANGGFALKKVRTFFRLTKRFKPWLDLYATVARLRGRGIWEDMLVNRHFPRLSRRFSLPPRAVAERFGAEFVDFDPVDLPFSARSPDTLPFGVHGWPQFQPDYWRPVIRGYGHAV